ncbi:hypothetical protein H5U56_21970, partial [Escherichia coli]|nr:hypothetical protein [Escherichia coli]
NILRDSLGLE